MRTWLAILTLTVTALQAAPSGLARHQTPACWSLRRGGQAEESLACFDRLAKSKDLADRAEAAWGLGQFNDANSLFKQAHAQHPNDPALKVRWGRMLFERYNPNDAAGLFDEATKIDEKFAPAYVGLARVAANVFSGSAYELLRKAMELDPKLAEAPEVLARVALEDSNEAEARKAALKAVELSPLALDGMAILATIDLLGEKKDSPWFDKMLAVNPHYGEGYAEAARIVILNRRYEEGVALYRKALELSPELDAARSQLGINLMRLGQEQEARQLLQQCYDRGWRDAATANSLTLIDSYKNFDTYRTDAFALRLHKKEAALLKPYFETQLSAALTRYDEKYKFHLPRAAQLEVYPDHEDFAVRTLGMPGLGALGVTFGTTVAMDSPSGRAPGSFHWASTLWHEMSHVYTLTMTQHKVPRWFTEGVAVQEETATSPDWGDRLDGQIVSAIREKQLLPILQLDRGFTRPDMPAQVLVSYFQAGKTIDFIVERWGWSQVLKMIADFAADKKTAEAIIDATKLQPEEFDKQFLLWLDGKVGAQVRNYDQWRKDMAHLESLWQAKKYDEMIEVGQKARDLFPEYVEVNSAYELLSKAREAMGDHAGAIDELRRYAEVGGRAPRLLVQLAKWQKDAGDTKAAVLTLDRLSLIDLRDEEPHRLHGEWSLELSQPSDAVREFRAALAINKTDPARGHYDLARALVAMGKASEARDELMDALEVAPNYKPAQQLLLKIEGKQAGS